MINNKQVASYSQNDEQSYILEYFRDQPPGKFVDIGAFHVFRFSNTRALYERGWNGVLVEPSPQNFKGLLDHYKDEPRIMVLPLAVGDPDGYIDFYESDGDAVSTTDIDHMKKWGDAGVKYTKISVKQMGVSSFMYAFGDCDFLSIDTESTNLALFRAVPDYVFQRIKLLCIEHDGGHDEIAARLEPFGFRVIHMNAENLIMGK